MAQGYYSKNKNPPLTEDEIKGKYKEIQEEMQEVLKWKKETEVNIDNPNISPQKRGAAKRAMKKIAWRINTVEGQIIYWKLRIKGESHFKSNIEKNEYWASCREKAEDTLKGTRETKKKEYPNNPKVARGHKLAELPNILKKKL